MPIDDKALSNGCKEWLLGKNGPRPFHIQSVSAAWLAGRKALLEEVLVVASKVLPEHSAIAVIDAIKSHFGAAP